MRLERLELARYGTLDALSLDLSHAGALHVIYGHNEAGKSTTRRAIGDLFYGISSDVYSPAPDQLGVTGTLSAGGVSSVTVTRRKGRKNTLVFPGGAPCPADVLVPFLGGIDRETFEIMFGLDHESLRLGGEAILRGEGDVGETLFEAGSGLLHVSELGRALRAEHEKLHAPRSKRELNLALDRLKKEQKAVREAILTTDAYQDQERGLALFQAKIAAIEEERTSSEGELARKRRVAKVLPLLAERARRLAQRDELGEVVLLPHEAPQERLGAEENARRASARIAALEIDIAAHARMEEAAVFSPEIAGAVERLGGLAGDLGTLAHEERELARAREDAARLSDVAAPDAAGTRDITLALGEIEGESGIDLALEEASIAAHAERRACSDALSSLGLACELEAVPRMALVPLETVLLHEQRIRAQDERTRSLEGALVRAEEATATADAQLAETLAAGDLPDETVLLKLRLERDLAVQDLVEKGSGYAQKAERAITAADDLADRLLRDAARVAARARAQAAAKIAADERRAAARRLDEAQREGLRVRAAWASLSAQAGLPAQEPAAARGWLDRRAELVRAVGALERRDLDVAALRERRRALLGRAERALAGAGAGGVRAAIARLRAAKEERDRCASEAARRAEATLRARQIEARVAAFHARVRDLVREYAPELATLAPAEAARELVDRHRTAETARAQKATYTRLREERTRDLTEQRGLLAEAERRLADLVRAAGVSDAAMLPAAEDRSRTRREVDEAILRLDLRIAEAGGGVPTERLAAECAGEDLQLVRARIDSLDRRLEELGEAWKGAHEDVVRTELGLQGMKDRTLGASLAVDAESTLASIRDLAERWAELKLGAAILARRVARYREKTEVPLLDRASVHFGALTDGAFSGLRAEGKTLVAIRVKGKELAVKALSDGTRDALYVALRVASLERIAATGKALPLVLDDVLVHLDDTRARASLRVLATLARSMQVLFFTHHARLVELAREVVAEEALVVRELGAARAG